MLSIGIAITMIFSRYARCGIFFLLLVAGADLALGHEHWMSQNGFVSPKGLEWCCSEIDCRMVQSDDVRTTKGGFLLPDGELIPYAAALKSQDEHYWRCRSPGRPTRCFFYPPPGI